MMHSTVYAPAIMLWMRVAVYRNLFLLFLATKLLIMCSLGLCACGIVPYVLCSPGGMGSKTGLPHGHSRDKSMLDTRLSPCTQGVSAAHMAMTAHGMAACPCPAPEFCVWVRVMCLWVQVGSGLHHACMTVTHACCAIMRGGGSPCHRHCPRSCHTSAAFTPSPKLLASCTLPTHVAHVPAATPVARLVWV